MTFLGLSFFLYFAPAIVASSRQHPGSTAIWFINFFVGWTGIGWLACLIWALSVPRPVLLYPIVAYAAPRAIPGSPTHWRSADGREESLCFACYRPLRESSPYCTMCGALTRRSA